MEQEMPHLETLESRRLFAVSLTLINADNNAVVKTLSDGLDIDLSQTPITNYSIDAKSNLAAASARMTEVESGSTRVESVKPFALFGDNGSGDYYGQKLSAGTHTIKVDFYSA